jgi:hypothetical protein
MPINTTSWCRYSKFITTISQSQFPNHATYKYNCHFNPQSRLSAVARIIITGLLERYLLSVTEMQINDNAEILPSIEYTVIDVM